LAGLKVLVVEDDPLVLLDTAHVLTRAGAIVAVAVTAKVALNLIEHGGIDCAVLDFRLESGTAAAVADRLTAPGRGFVYYTGSIAGPLQARPGAMILPKPTGPDELIAAVHVACRNNAEAQARPQREPSSANDKG